MSPIGRDPEQRDPLRPPRESLRETLVERQIREGMESGAFDDLPHQGRRLPLADESAAGDWAMAHRMLRNAGAAPPWIEADKEVRALLERRDALIARAPLVGVSGLVRLRRELADVVVAVNLAIERVNAEAPTDRRHRRRLDGAEEAAKLEAAPRTPIEGPRRAGGRDPDGVSPTHTLTTATHDHPRREPVFGILGGRSCTAVRKTLLGPTATSGSCTAVANV